MGVERSNPCDSQQSKGHVARICNPYTPQWQRMNVFKKLQQKKTLIESPLFQVCESGRMFCYMDYRINNHAMQALFYLDLMQDIKNNTQK